VNNFHKSISQARLPKGHEKPMTANVGPKNWMFFFALKGRQHKSPGQRPGEI